MKISEFRKLLREEIRNIISEGFIPTEITAMIFIGKYPYYVEKIDSTHLYFVNNEKALKNRLGMAIHIGQMNGEKYYDDLRSWLKGGLSSKKLNGKKYIESNKL